MTVAFDSLQRNHLSYAAIFGCVGVGFLCLRKIYKHEVGPGYWAAGFFSNSIGFLLWSGSIHVRPWLYFLLGDAFHIAGFIFLVAGAYRFSGNEYKKWNAAVLAAWVSVWVVSVLFYRTNYFAAMFILKALRSVIFISTGTLLIIEKNTEEKIGKNVAGISLAVWGIYIMVFSFIKIDAHLYFGFLAGFQILAAFGMVSLVMDKIRVRAEKGEKHIQQLEGILPICSYCKKIRDEKNEWQVLEAYIEDRSKAEFSHGICPECFKKHRPDR